MNFAVDHGKDPFRFIHFNIQAILKRKQQKMIKAKCYQFPNVGFIEQKLPKKF